MFLPFIFLVISISSAFTREPLLIQNLNGLSSSSPEYDAIFRPHHINKHGNHTKHNIHVIDTFGKYLKLSYEAVHPSNVNILKTDDKTHKTHIESLLCHHDTNNTITLHFKTNIIALNYYNNIQSSIHDQNEKQYLTASHEWQCIHPTKQRYESIIRYVTDVRINATNNKVLILTTKQATLTDIFQHLHIKYTTNIGQHTHKKHYINNRRRLSFSGTLSAIWHRITDSIQSLRDDILAVLNGIKDVTTEFIRYERGDPVDFNEESEVSWSWNADDTESFELSNDIICKDCWAQFDGEYDYTLDITNSEVAYLATYVSGPLAINLCIKGPISVKITLFEWSINTPKLPIPDVSVAVAGVVFGLYISGQFAIGIDLTVNAFSYQVDAVGPIKKGIEYDAATGTQNYINEQQFTYNQFGPKIEFQSAKVRVYARALINLGLSYVGTIGFGIMPDFGLRFEKQEPSSDCALYYTPTAALTVFIRAQLELLPFFYKDFPVTVVQTDITHWGGCLSQWDVTKIETADYVYDDDDDYRRRTMNVWNVSDDDTTYLDFSKTEKHQYTNEKGWGRTGTRWWSNMSTISHICNTYSMTCFDYKDVPILEPDMASLLVSVEDDALIAVLRTEIEISPSNRWNVKNVSLYTNISCVTRHKLMYNEYVSSINQIETYDVYRLEWYCDSDLAYIGIDEDNNTRDYDAWICMISLPAQLHAMQLGFEFRNIMLFDKTWCKVFELIKKQKYSMDYIQNVTKYPSKLWYGMIDCKNETGSVEMYFNYDYYPNDSVSVVLSIQYNNGTNSTLYGETQLDFNDMTIIIDVLYWNELSLSFEKGDFRFIGIMNVLNDGTMTYYGTIAESGCIGFIFQGFLNLTQFESIKSVDNGASVPIISNSDIKRNIMIFVGGVLSTLICVAFIWIVYRYKNKSLPSSKYHLMDDGDL